MLELYENDDYLSAFTLRVMAEELILEVMQQTKQTSPIITYSKLVRQIIQIIIKAPHMSITAATLAKKFSVSTSQIYNRFAAEVGTSLGKYVRSKVLSAAIEDLKNESLSIKDIAAKYGFCDQFYFSRLFTAQYGISPSQYRKRNII